MEKREMTSKERVLAVFRKQKPDRVPMWCGMSPEFIEKVKQHYQLTTEDQVQTLFHTDFRRVHSRFDAHGACPYEAAIHAGKASVFGSLREGIGWGLPSAYPLENATLVEVEAYPWPKPTWQDVSHLRADALQYAGEYAILGGEWCPFFHDAVDMLGMENMFIKMYEEPEIVHAVLAHIVDYYYEVCKMDFDAADGAIDIFFLGNDFGSQMGPLLGQGLFQEFLAPHLKRLCDLAHSYGIYTMLHCCGSFAELMPLLIACGVDAVQALQPITPSMQPAALLEQFGDSIIFNGCIDSLDVLIRGTPEGTTAATKEVIRVMQRYGNFILSASHDYILEETPVENVLAMFEAGLQYGAYGL